MNGYYVCKYELFEAAEKYNADPEHKVKLTQTDILIYSIVRSFKECYLTNEQFATYTLSSKSSVIRSINKLIKIGLISKKYVNQKRVLRGVTMTLEGCHHDTQ